MIPFRVRLALLLERVRAALRRPSARVDFVRFRPARPSPEAPADDNAEPEISTAIEAPASAYSARRVVHYGPPQRAPQRTAQGAELPAEQHDAPFNPSAMPEIRADRT